MTQTLHLDARQEHFGGELQVGYRRTAERLYCLAYDGRRLAYTDSKGDVHCHAMDTPPLQMADFVMAPPLPVDGMPAYERQSVANVMQALINGVNDITWGYQLDAMPHSRGRRLRAVRAQVLQGALLLVNHFGQLTDDNFRGIRDNAERLLREQPALRLWLTQVLRASRWPGIAAIGNHLMLEDMVVQAPASTATAAPVRPRSRL